MPKREVRHERGREESGVPPWKPPTPPRLGVRERVALLFDHFGFWMACVLSFAVIVFLYVTADQFLNADEAAGPSNSEVQQTAAEEALGRVEASDTVAVVNVPLSITTDPLGASIYVDGEYVGISPVRGVSVAGGRRRISVQVRDYTPFDTVMTLEGSAASLQLILRGAHLVALSTETEEALPDAPGVLAEADSANPPALPEEQPASSRAAAETASEAPARPTVETAPAVVGDAEPVRAKKTPGAPVEKKPGADKAVPATIKEAKPHTAAEATPAALVGELQINSEPPGASVLVEGRKMGVTPLLMTDVEAGPQHITLRRDGYKDFTTTVEVTATKQHTVNGQLEQLLGTLRILVKPWGDIYIDGDLHRQESGVWYTTELSPGFHNVRVVHPKLGRWEQVVEVRADEALPLTVDFNVEN